MKTLKTKTLRIILIAWLTCFLIYFALGLLEIIPDYFLSERIFYFSVVLAYFFMLVFRKQLSGN